MTVLDVVTTWSWTLGKVVYLHNARLVQCLLDLSVGLYPTRVTNPLENLHLIDQMIVEP